MLVFGSVCPDRILGIGFPYNPILFFGWDWNPKNSRDGSGFLGLFLNGNKTFWTKGHLYVVMCWLWFVLFLCLFHLLVVLHSVHNFCLPVIGPLFPITHPCRNKTSLSQPNRPENQEFIRNPSWYSLEVGSVLGQNGTSPFLFGVDLFTSNQSLTANLPLAKKKALGVKSWWISDYPP